VSVKIIVDSCCEVPPLWADKVGVASLSIKVDNVMFIDSNLNMPQYLAALRNMHTFKTSCPSPQDYLKLYEGEQDIIVITLSSKLSGSYQSACIARDIFFESNGKDKQIHVIDSKSASAGETAILVKAMELCRQYSDFEQIVFQLEGFRNEHKILFVLQSLSNLAKAGRVSPLIAKAASVLGMRCVMSRTNEGEIKLQQKFIGEKRCLRELAKQISALALDMAERTLCISHCESKERVYSFLKNLSEYIDLNRFKNILINHTGGISSIYADFGGIIVSL